MKAGWQESPIGEVFRVVNGGTPKTGVAAYWDGPHAWITPAEMGGLETPLLSGSRRTLTDEGLRVGAELVPEGSIILSTRAPIGHLVINEVPMAFNQGCKGLVPSTGVDTKFAYYFLLANVPLLESLGTGATFKELSGGKLKEVPFRFPELSEQRRIVAILDEAFEGIATAKAHAERNLRNAREVFERELEALFSGVIPRSVSSTLGSAYDVRDGTHDSPKYHDQGYPLVTSKNLKRDGLSLDDVKLIDGTDFRKINERSAVHRGDVLFAMIGTIGNPTVVETEPNFAIKNVALLKVSPHQSGHFLRYYLSSQGVATKMQAEAKGTTQKFVGLGYLRAFPIAVPPLEEQLSIVRELDDLLAETDRLEDIYARKLAVLDELKQSLLHQAVSGQL
ncbi:MAG: restriction endonuclease subunit S [Ideonella sp. WA131b]|nr:restriction endonuclease subunit S [Ideonella sp. WA131b]